MSEYTVYVRVVNRWSTPIGGSVRYVTASFPALTIPFSELRPGASTPEFAIVTTGTGLDYWSYMMQDASNHSWSGQLQCAVDPADDGGTIDCAFDVEPMELQVIMPGSRPCSQSLKGHVGFMQVRNTLDGPVSGWVMHQTTEFGTSIVAFEGLEKGEETQIAAITSGASSLDRWHYGITFDGVSYHGVHKCSFAPEYAGKATILEFGVPRVDIPAIRTIMPDFSSCYTHLIQEAAAMASA